MKTDILNTIEHSNNLIISPDMDGFMSAKLLFAGLNLYVTPNTAAGTDTDGSIIIVNPDAYTWYESPTYRLRAESTAAGQITIGYYGYGAIATKVGAGAFKNNKA
jgi:hypothetical protein